jgi:hypothetical protein
MAGFNQASRKIGNALVPSVGFGAMGISMQAYGPIDSDEDRFKVCNELEHTDATHRISSCCTVHSRCPTLPTRKAVHIGIPLICMAIPKNFLGNGASISVLPCQDTRMDISLSGSNAPGKGMRSFY